MKKFLILSAIITSILHSQASEGPTGNVTGFDGIQWGSAYGEVKDRIRALSSSPETRDPVVIVSDDPGREIRVKRKDVLYRYVFYKKPEIINKTAGNVATPNDAGPKDENGNNNRLFLVESSFSYVPALELETRLAEKYGRRSGGTIDEKTKRGFFLWEMPGGYVVQWVDPYKKKPFTRNLYYASKDILAEIRADYERFQYTREIQTLLDIVY